MRGDRVRSAPRFNLALHGILPAVGIVLDGYLIYRGFLHSLWDAGWHTGRSVVVGGLLLAVVALPWAGYVRARRRGDIDTDEDSRNRPASAPTDSRANSRRRGRTISVTEPAGHRLAGKTALITGAAGGIGRAVAQRFAHEGARVFCVDRDDPGLTDTVDQIQARGADATAHLADVTDAEAMIAAAVDTYGRLNVLHANAAVQVMGNLETTTPADWDSMYAVNQRAIAASIRAAVPHMRRAGGGAIILTSSLLGITGDPDLAMYGATKGALRALCRSVAAAYGPDNIRCNTICPGDVDTEMVRAFFAYQPDPAAARADIEQRYPLRRFAQPADIANAALFLASDEANYITGTDLVVDGGLLARIY